jgi:predicted Rossmann-fold nucleotide-binding protein
MGEIARSLVSLSGPESVHGIIPAPLVKYERGPDSEVSTGGILPEYSVYGKTTVVKDMHTRKQMMAQEVLAGGKGSGFVALPGGYGTLEELMEVVTWNQLGIHNRGVVVFNAEGYWDGLLNWVKKSVEAGFVGEGNKDIIRAEKTAEDVVRALREYKVAKGRFKLEWGNE